MSINAMYSHFDAIKNFHPLFTLYQCTANYIGINAAINVCISSQTKKQQVCFRFVRERFVSLSCVLHLPVEIVKKTLQLSEKNKKNVHCVKLSAFPK